MSGAQTPTLGPAQSNALFNPLAVPQAQELQNKLAGQQIDLSNANQAQVQAAAAGLLSGFTDEASRAEAYPKYVGMLQKDGYAMNAPAQYPGEAYLRAIVNQGIPAKDLYSSGALLTPAQQQFLNTGTATSTPATGAPGSTPGATAAPSLTIPARGTGGPGASASAPTEWLPYFEEASQKTGIPVDLLIAQARQESGFNPNNVGTAGEIGLFQIKPSTAQNPGIGGMQGVDPASITGPNNVRNNIMFGAQYLKAQMGNGDPNNPAVQAAALRGYNGRGPGGDPNYVANVFRYRPTLAPSDPNAAVTSYTPPSAGTATASAPAGGGGTPGSYQVASTAPTAPPGSTAAPAAAPASPAPDTPWDLPGAPAPDLPPPSTPTAAPAPAAAPAQPQQAPGPTAQPAPAPAAAPASTSRLPEVSTIPTGRNSAAWQQAQQLIDKGQRMLQVAGNNAGFRAQAQAMIAEGQREQQLDHIVSAQQGGREGKLNTTTGEFTPYTPLPSPRGMQGTAGAWDGTKWVPVTPENQASAVRGTWAVTGSGAQFFPNSPAGIQAQEAAKTSGAAAGTATGKLTAALADQGRSSAQAIGNIDYGLSQLEKAKAGGVNTGYFAPWLSTVGAIAKSIGGDTGAQLLGIDPKAVGNIQTAQKTLAVVSGAILQQVLGPDSQITDAKLQHFIHAQPGIETDPDAVSRVLNWARSQFVYEREQAAQGMKDASATGVLPTNWQANYYDKHGFAPIYNPGTGEMQQPDGSAPPRQAPATMATAPVNPANRTVGTTYSTPKGPLKWDGSLWVAP